MGRGNTKLREFNEITANLRKHRDAIGALQNLRLLSLTQAEFETVSSQIWALIEGLSISIAEARIVANTKTLHHILPDLIPPIDRTYTFNLFYGRAMLSISERDAFGEMFTRFHRLALKSCSIVEGLVGSGWNTSETKVLDNAVVGYAIDVLNVRSDDVAGGPPPIQS